MTIPWVLWFQSSFFHFLMGDICMWCGVVQGSKYSAVDLHVTAEDLLSSLMPLICTACSCSIQVLQSWYLQNFIILGWSWWSFRWQNQIKITVIFIICLIFICVCHVHHCLSFRVVVVHLYFVSSSVIFICCTSCLLPFRFGLKILIDGLFHKPFQCAPGCPVHSLCQKYEMWSFVFQSQVNLFWGVTYVTSTLCWSIPQFF